MRTKSKTKSKVSQLVEVRTKIVLGIMFVAAYMVATSLIVLPMANLDKAMEKPVKSINSIKVTKTKVQKTDSGDWGADRLLSVCDFNSDSVRDLSDVAFFAECQNTFDANGDGEHNLSDLGLYAQHNQDDTWCLANMSECYAEEQNTLNVCDFNEDGVRDVADVPFFAECQDTFDANNDSVHNLNDVVLYTQNNQDDEWCLANMSECYAEEQNTLNVCDFNYDGVRDLIDVNIFSRCQNEFDANGDGVHDLADIALYAQNNQDDEWCADNMFPCSWGYDRN